MRKGRILDIGCARGLFLKTLERVGHTAYGTELSEESARTARALVGEDRIRVGPLVDCGFDEGQFDAVTAWQVFEHLHDPAETLAELHADELTAATHCRHSPHGALSDLLAGAAPLAAIDDLRALCLEAQLAAYLREGFGDAFWRERGAGDLLKELWSTGSTYTPASLAVELGLGEIAPGALLEELAEP